MIIAVICPKEQATTHPCHQLRALLATQPWSRYGLLYLQPIWAPTEMSCHWRAGGREHGWQCMEGMACIHPWLSIPRCNSFPRKRLPDLKTSHANCRSETNCIHLHMDMPRLPVTGDGLKVSVQSLGCLFLIKPKETLSYIL